MEHNLYSKASECERAGDIARAEAFYREGVAEGDVICRYRLTKLQQKSGAISAEKAAEIYREVHDDLVAQVTANTNENEDDLVLLTLGSMYIEGDGVEKDEAKGFYWCRVYSHEKAAARGDARSQYMFSRAYREGRGLPKDKEKAFEWCKKAAEQGDAEAQCSLGWMYENGEGVEQDYVKAIEWYTKAAEQGWARAQLYYGLMYALGYGVEQDHAKAAEWYAKAAEQGDTEAQFLIASRYAAGKGVPQDYTQALEWHTKAAEQGHAEAQCSLGWMYENGEGVEQDYVKAVEWYTKAAEQGDSGARLNLALLYYDGTGVERDYEKAFAYCRQSVDALEHPGEADYFLGECYHWGYGTAVDYQAAKACYEAAIANGYDCHYALEVIKRDLGECDGLCDMRGYAEEISALKLSTQELTARVRADLTEEFGPLWSRLKPCVQAALISGTVTYLSLSELAREGGGSDFTPAIVTGVKALELQLAELFYTRYLEFLQEGGTSPAEFGPGQCFIRVEKTKDGDEIYSFCDKGDIFRFSLGTFHAVLDSKTAGEDEPDEPSAGRSTPYRSSAEGVKTISRYAAEFGDRIFREDAFAGAERESGIVNYLIDLAADTQDIKRTRNNAVYLTSAPSDHGEACGELLAKVKWLLADLLGKIRDEYKR